MKTVTVKAHYTISKLSWWRRLLRIPTWQPMVITFDEPLTPVAGDHLTIFYPERLEWDRHGGANGAINVRIETEESGQSSEVATERRVILDDEGVWRFAGEPAAPAFNEHVPSAADFAEGE